MTNLTVADYLKYANLQMAAEAFLANEAGVLVGDIATALVLGNKHASKFAEAQATAFVDPETGWTVVAQKANTPTGFSGTLIRNNQTDELVLSFRSAEFIDDNLNDSQATNILELKAHGFAYGSIGDTVLGTVLGTDHVLLLRDASARPARSYIAAADSAFQPVAAQ
jgi:hypothetical protein